MSKYAHKRSDLIERMESVIPTFETLSESLDGEYFKGFFAGYHDAYKTVVEALSEVE